MITYNLTTITFFPSCLYWLLHLHKICSYFLHPLSCWSLFQRSPVHTNLPSVFLFFHLHVHLHLCLFYIKCIGRTVLVFVYSFALLERFCIFRGTRYDIFSNLELHTGKRSPELLNSQVEWHLWTIKLLINLQKPCFHYRGEIIYNLEWITLWYTILTSLSDTTFC